MGKTVNPETVAGNEEDEEEAVEVDAVVRFCFCFAGDEDDTMASYEATAKITLLSVAAGLGVNIRSDGSGCRDEVKQEPRENVSAKTSSRLGQLFGNSFQSKQRILGV